MIIDFNKLNINELSPTTDFENQVVEFVKEWQDSGQTTTIKTSGSTGRAKVLEVHKEKMRNSARKTLSFLGLKRGDTALLCLPIEYISGKMMVIRAIEGGLKLKILTPSSRIELPKGEYFDFCAMTPLQVENSLSGLRQIRNLIVGGAGVAEALKRKIASELSNDTSLPPDSIRIFETYGMSETLSHIALKEIYPTQATYFTLFEGVKISLSEKDAVIIEAPDLSDEIIKTTDRVELRGEKEFRFIGRLDHVINSAGVKVYPEELERFIKQHVDQDVVVSSIWDESLGDKLVLVVEGAENKKLKNKILALSFEKSYLRPKEIFFWLELPRTPNGKISRLEVKKKLSE